MAKTLEDIIKAQITQHGPMDVGQFMTLALAHPEHGYYMKRDPLGAAGDFTTAPEISQMFGEVLGAWVVDVWAQMGRPASFSFVECGPGRGTLMADMMRAAGNVPGFLKACNIHLLETSPVLRKAQEKALKGHKVIWHDTLDGVPDDVPIIVIGNEFLDALPIRQFVKSRDGWQERVIGLEGDALAFGVVDTALEPKGFMAAQVGDIAEIAPAREGFVTQLCGLMQRAGGAALFIDYGHMRSAVGDTFQAVKAHEFTSPLEHVGDADLTSHVDFDALGQVASGVGARVLSAVEQGAFLHALGIGARAMYLSQKADDKQVKDIDQALHRLTHSDQMGSLFKVIGFTYDDEIHPAGF